MGSALAISPASHCISPSRVSHGGLRLDVDLARRSGTDGEREDGPWRSRSARYAERLCRGTVSAFLKAGAGSWTSTVNIVAHIIEWAKAKAHWVRAA